MCANSDNVRIIGGDGKHVLLAGARVLLVSERMPSFKNNRKGADAAHLPSPHLRCPHPPIQLCAQAVAQRHAYATIMMSRSVVSHDAEEGRGRRQSKTAGGW